MFCFNIYTVLKALTVIEFTIKNGPLMGIKEFGEDIKKFKVMEDIYIIENTLDKAAPSINSLSRSELKIYS